MSLDADSIICSKCSFKALITYRPKLLVYEIDEQFFETGRCYGWCYQCNTISDIEPEFNVNDIKHKLEELKSNPVLKKNFISKFFNKTASAEAQANIHKLEIQYEIASSRLSPRRCLECGGGSIEEIKSFDGEFFNHNCGGFLSVLPISEYDSPTRFMYKTERIYLNIDGVRIDRSNYSKQKTIIEPAEFLLMDMYQQIIEVDYKIHDLLKKDLQLQINEIDFDEISIFSLTVLSYLILRFSNLRSKEQFLDKLAIITMEELNHAHIDDQMDELIIVYQTRYKEYTKLIELLFSPELSKSGNPTITLALQLYEMVTKQSSKGKMMEITYIGKILSELIIEQIEYIETKINQNIRT